MGEIVQLPRPQPSHSGEDTIWAVMAAVGKAERIADVYPTRMAALADRAWREQQVRAYAALLRATRKAIPRYSVAPISARRSAPAVDTAASPGFLARPIRSDGKAAPGVGRAG